MLKNIHWIKNPIWIMYIVLTSILFITCVWFHYSYTQSILISSLWKNPLSFWGFYLPKLFISMLFASAIFFMKRKWSVLLYTCILFLWFYANTIYIRSYGAPLDAFAMTMAGNMNGFWNEDCSQEEQDKRYFEAVEIMKLYEYISSAYPEKAVGFKETE